MESISQSLAPDALVCLFTLDATNLGAGVLRFTNMTDNGAKVSFGGNEYEPIPFETSGWEITSKGSLPRPSLSLSMNSVVVSSLIRNYDDGIGAWVYRIRTFARFLDGHAQPDGNAHFPIDIYRVERKVDETKGYIKWELASVLDLEGVQIPRRQILRDVCTHIYRRWNGSSFDYSAATCPYVGANKFTHLGEATTNGAEDVCGKRLSDCKLRFGENGELPTRAFPGVARVRIR
jgi:lambda family phage minor tail protein L